MMAMLLALVVTTSCSKKDDTPVSKYEGYTELVYMTDMYWGSGSYQYYTEYGHDYIIRDEDHSGEYHEAEFAEEIYIESSAFETANFAYSEEDDIYRIQGTFRLKLKKDGVLIEDNGFHSMWIAKR